MLTPEDQALLETTLLPALERHFLRLLAHGLRTFQAIAASSGESDRLPDPPQIASWVASQGPLADDPAFQEAFVEQLCSLRPPLEAIGDLEGRAPLDLPMEALVAWVSSQAATRVNSPPAAGTIPPPG
ncbi:MAG: hypothetical protein ACK6BG_01640 [Cyanobacteriota bacterium]|jgi:hypothetical protein